MAPTLKRSRAFAFTWNNYTDEVESQLQAEPYVYQVYGKELAPTTGTPHLQGYIRYRSARSLESVRKRLKGAHVEVAISEFHLDKYCQKDGIAFQDGVAPMSQKSKGVAEQERWKAIVAAVKDGRMHELAETEPKAYAMHYSKFKSIEKDFMKSPPDLEGCSGIWVSGPPGTGKSHWVREQYPRAFDKLLNKWWDGYQGEQYVLLDDFDHNHKCLGSHLKRWADRYAFKVEIKNGALNVRPKLIIVTSNYEIEDIWQEDQQMAAAISRRFKKHKFYAGPYGTNHKEE